MRSGPLRPTAETTKKPTNINTKITGNITSATPIAGPVCQALFLGIDSYITSLGSKKKELREEIGEVDLNVD